MKYIFEKKIFLLLGTFFAVFRLYAGGGPENVFLVINEDSLASKAIANEYISLRNIPQVNVFYLNGIRNLNSIPINDFREKILQPILKTATERGLDKQIDYIVYSSDLPWRVDCKADLNGKKLPKIMSPFGSINSMTYLYQAVMAKKPGAYLSLSSNLYTRKPFSKHIKGNVWTEKELELQQDVQKLLVEKNRRDSVRLAEYKKKLKTEGKKYKHGMMPEKSPEDKTWETAMWKQLIGIISKLREKHTNAPSLLYNLACAFAMDNKPDKAMTALRSAYESGWWDYRHTLQDRDLISLRKRKDFKDLIQKMKDVKFKIPPTIGFRSTYGWLPNGNITNSMKSRRYVLSTVLGITSGRGNSIPEVISYLRRAASADRTSPEGTIYIMRNRNVRSTTREWAFKRTVELLHERNVKAEIIDGVLPENKPDVMGTVVGAAKFDWSKCGSTILPGAICEHLTSAGGVMRSGAGQTALTEFLKFGAAGASGTVVEPYALQAKFPMPLIQVFYADGASLAEAFYQSVAGPYQLLIVGDPLCQPWAEKFKVSLDGLKKNSVVKNSINLKPKIISTGGGGIAFFDFFLDGRLIHRMKSGDSFELNTGKFPDGYHELRLVGVLKNSIQTQSRDVIPFIIANHNRTFRVEPPTSEIKYDGILKLHAKFKGAKKIRFFHNDRSVGEINGSKGQVEISAEKLGPGKVILYPIADISKDGKTQIYGQPVNVTVQMPENNNKN